MHPPQPMIRVHRNLDLARIDAVGFDLDHTLAIYDDAAVNDIATVAARRLLVERLGYPRAVQDGPSRHAIPAAARTLAADLAHGAVVKLGSERRVVHGRMGGRWLADGDIRRRYGAPVPDDADSAYTVYSPFELPVLWLCEEMEGLGLSTPRAARCADVRRMLDAAHTGGALKTRLREDLGRYVSGIRGVAEGLARWAAAGKRLFVVTNSEPEFATAVLDCAVGPAWRDLFEVVVAGARKPAFFHPATAPSHASAHAARGAVVHVESATALEVTLGLARGRVLFVGDNTRSDILAARAHGWHTAQVVPEFGHVPTDDPDGWGNPLEHLGAPTWFAGLVRAADLACGHVGTLLAADPYGALVAGDAPQERETP